jgi:hypothetical protein
MPICDLKNVDEDTIAQHWLIPEDDIFRVKKKWRAVDMDKIRLWDIDDLLTWK